MIAQLKGVHALFGTGHNSDVGKRISKAREAWLGRMRENALWIMEKLQGNLCPRDMGRKLRSWKENVRVWVSNLKWKTKETEGKRCQVTVSDMEELA